MNYPEEIVIEGEDLQFWKRYSGLIADLADRDTELTLERGFFNIINPNSELVDENVYPPESSELYWSMFVDLVQGNRVGGFSKDDLLYLDPRKGYTKKRLIRLLDYIDLPTNKQSLDALKQYVFNHQMNSVAQPTVPRGIGIHKAQYTYKLPKQYRYVNYNYNNNGINDYENYIKNKETNNNDNDRLDNAYNYNSDENANLKRLLATVAKPLPPYSKTAKQRKLKRRHHTRMTKSMRAQNMRKPKKNRRIEKTAKRYNKKNRNNNMNANAINYFHDNNNNMNSTFSFDD